MTIWQNCLSQGLRLPCTAQFKLGEALWQKEEDKRKGSVLLEPNSSEHFLYFPFNRYSRWSYQNQEEAQYDLGKTRIAVSKNTWRIHQNIVYRCNFEAPTEKRMTVLSNTIQRNRFFQHFTCDMCWESGKHEDWRRIVQQSVSTPRLPRAVLTPNLHHGRQDLSNPEARTSADHQS